MQEIFHKKVICQCFICYLLAREHQIYAHFEYILYIQLDFFHCVCIIYSKCLHSRFNIHFTHITRHSTISAVNFGDNALLVPVYLHKYLAHYYGFRVDFRLLQSNLCAYLTNIIVWLPLELREPFAKRSNGLWQTNLIGKMCQDIMLQHNLIDG